MASQSILFRFLAIAFALTCLLAAGLSEARPNRLPIATVKAAPTSSADSVFCKSFVKQCYKSALAGQIKEVTVVHSCQRNGGKHSTSYTYSCKRGKTSLTSKVLNALGDEYAAYTTITSSTTTTVGVLPAATTTITTEIPVTVTTVVPSTVTQVSYTSTSTAVYLGTDEVPVYEVVVAGSSGRERRRGTDAFCAAYSTACTKECSAASSKVKHSICNAKSSSRYTLACVCKNGKQETQHALAALVEDRKTITVSTVATFTSLVTDSLTTSYSTSVVTSGAVTFTTTVPVTSTYTFLSTSTTASTLTEYTGQSVTEVALSTSGVTTTTTTAATTTQLVLAATGYAHGISTADGTDFGALGSIPDDSSARFASSIGRPVAVELMAVRDAATGSYQLAKLGDPTTVLISEASQPRVDFEIGTNANALTYFGQASLCGTAGSAAGPAAGSGINSRPCQTFVFAPLALDDSAGATSDTLNLQPIWYNPTGSVTSVNMGAWFYLYHAILAQAADHDATEPYYVAYYGTRITLRFPFPS